MIPEPLCGVRFWTRGLVALNEITVIPRANWTSLTAGQVRIQDEKLISLAPNTELPTALQIMDEAGVAEVPVNENGQINRTR